MVKCVWRRYDERLCTQTKMFSSIFAFFAYSFVNIIVVSFLFTVVFNQWERKLLLLQLWTEVAMRLESILLHQMTDAVCVQCRRIKYHNLCILVKHGQYIHSMFLNSKPIHSRTLFQCTLFDSSSVSIVLYYLYCTQTMHSFNGGHGSSRVVINKR